MARKQPEATLVSGIRSRLERKYGGLWVKIHGGPYQKVGISDILGCLDGQFFAFEVKVPERVDKVTKQQEKFILNVNSSRGIAYVITSYEQAEEIVENWLNTGLVPNDGEGVIPNE